MGVWNLSPIEVLLCAEQVLAAIGEILISQDLISMVTGETTGKAEGSEMVSSDEKDEPFVLEKDQCWVVAENQEMKSKVHHLLSPLHNYLSM